MDTKEQGQGDVEKLFCEFCRVESSCLGGHKNCVRTRRFKPLFDSMYESKLRERIVAEFLAELKTHRQDDHFAGNTGFVDWQDIERVAEEMRK